MSTFPPPPEVTPKFLKDSMDTREIYGSKPGEKTGPGERATNEMRATVGGDRDVLNKGDETVKPGRVLGHLRADAVSKDPRPLLVTQDVSSKSFREDITKTHRHTSALLPAYRIHGEWIDSSADAKIHPSSLTRSRANEGELDMSLNHRDIPGAVPHNIGNPFPHMQARMKATDRPGGGNRGNLDIEGSTPGTAFRARNPLVFASMEDARRRTKRYEEEQAQLRAMQERMTHFADKALQSNVSQKDVEMAVTAKFGKTLTNREVDDSADFDLPQGPNRALRRNMGPGMLPLASGSFDHVKVKDKYANPTGKVVEQIEGPDYVSHTMKKYRPQHDFLNNTGHASPAVTSIIAAKKSNLGHGFMPHGGDSSFEEVKVKQRRNYKVDMKAAMMESIGHKMFSLNATAPPAGEGSFAPSAPVAEAPLDARISAEPIAQNGQFVEAGGYAETSSRDVREEVSAVRALGGRDEDAEPVQAAVSAEPGNAGIRHSEAPSRSADDTNFPRAHPRSPDPSLFPKEQFQARKPVGRRKKEEVKKLGSDLMPLFDPDSRPGRAPARGASSGIGPGFTLLKEDLPRGKQPVKLAPGAPVPNSSDPTPYVSHFVTSGHGATKSTLGDVLYAGKFGKSFDRPWDNMPSGLGNRSELTGVGEGTASLTRLGAGSKPDGKPASRVLQKVITPQSENGSLTVADSDRLRRIRSLPKSQPLTLTSFRDSSNAQKVAIARRELLAEIDTVRCLS